MQSVLDLFWSTGVKWVESAFGPSPDYPLDAKTTSTGDWDEKPKRRRPLRHEPAMELSTRWTSIRSFSKQEEPKGSSGLKASNLSGLPMAND